MTSVASTSLSTVPTTPDTTGREVEEAIQSFKQVLKANDLESELQEFEKEDKIPPVDAVLTFTAQLDSANPSRRGRSLSSSLQEGRKMQEHSSHLIANETIISSHIM